MAKYEVTLPDGRTVVVNSPTELSEDQVYSQAQEQGGGSAVSRGLSGFLSTSPLNPMNLVRAVAHPIDTVTGLVGDPLKNLLKAGGDVADVVTGNSGDRLISALNAVKHLGGSVPLIGPAGINAGEKIGEGDVAGGVGELAGIASGALVPKIASRAPGTLQSLGGMVERGGNAMRKPLSMPGIVELAHNPAVGVPMLAGPLAMEYAGKGMKATGAGLESLKNRATASTESAPTGPRLLRRQSTEVPYRVQGELPTSSTPDIPVSESAPMSPIEQFYAENPMGAGRNTYTLNPGESAPSGSLADLAKMSRQQSVEALPDYGPEFDFEGSADYLPGESTPPPAAPGFEVGRPIGDSLFQNLESRPTAPTASSMAEQALLNSPSFRKLAALRPR